MSRERAILHGIADMDPAALEPLIGRTSDTLEASGLDPRTYALVRLASLVALDASPASFVWAVDDARRAGLSEEQLFGLLVAVGPTVGGPRIVSAAAEIWFALIDADLSDRRDRRADGRAGRDAAT